MKRWIRFKACCLIIAIIGCGKQEAIVETEEVQLNPISKHSLEVKSFILPRGVCRGVLYPDEKEPSFKITIDSDYEPAYLIPVSRDLLCGRLQDLWEFEYAKAENGYIIYSVTSNSKAIEFQIKLPVKKNDYTFHAYESITGKDVVVFVTISESVADKGLFGYILVEEK